MTPRVTRSRSDRPLPADGILRVAIESVLPQIDCGRYPLKRTPGEAVEVSADIFADGHDVLAGVLRYRQTGRDGRAQAWQETSLRLVDNDRWVARFVPLHAGDYQLTIDAWVDAFASWRSALVRRLAAHQVTEGDLLEGAALMRAAAARAKVASQKMSKMPPAAADAAEWLRAQAHAVASAGDVELRAQLALQPVLLDLMQRHPDRAVVTTLQRPLAVLVERERSRVGAWYEMFPRSASPETERSGTFLEAEARLPEIAAMGFDVLYLPPIHPIGTTARKGPGNAPVAGPNDPGSPWAIGSPDGGHMAIEPGLGTLDDFDHFVAAARRHGLEVALDLAYQCSPDHPYVREHPEWFRHHPDGSIKYAENPPKRYQDIYPIDFDTDAWPALWNELKRIVLFWTARGIRIFRVDNPHTKPFRFWEWLIRSVRDEHPDVIFLAEAFTRPKVMKHLAKLGFSQSYTYFTWRNTKTELTDYFTELTQTAMHEYFRPNLFANTPDILHAYLQTGGRAAFEVRLLLAATLGATYGIYSGFELCDGAAVPGSEEYLNSEKYDYRQRDWNQPGHIKDLVRKVNSIRTTERALQFDDTLAFHETDNSSIVAYSKSIDGRGLLMVVNLDPRNMQHGLVRVPLADLGLDGVAPYEVEDLLDGARYQWTGEWNYVRFDPGGRVGHVMKPVVGPRLPMVPAPLEEARLLEGPSLAAIEQDVLAPYLQRQRWFGGKARSILSTRVVDSAVIPTSRTPLFLAIGEVQYADATSERYQLPLVVLRDQAAAHLLRDTPDAVLARLADGGLLCDGVQDDEACRAMFESVRDESAFAGVDGPIVAESVNSLGQADHDAAMAPSPHRLKTPGDHDLTVGRLPPTHSNSAVTLGGRYLLKVFRRLEPGLNPDVEIGRFLAGLRRRSGALGDADVRVPALIGTVEYRPRAETLVTLVLVQELVHSDGSGWDHALRTLSGLFERTRGQRVPAAVSGPAGATLIQLSHTPVPAAVQTILNADLRSAALLGRRTFEMHRALASGPIGSAFGAERMSSVDVATMTNGLRHSAEAALRLLSARADTLTASSALLAVRVLHNSAALLGRFTAIGSTLGEMGIIRVHGDYHLGQILHVGGDFAIIDFEGEPARPLAERRKKQSPLRDVAGMLRSFSYAAQAGLAAAVDDEAGAPANAQWARSWERWMSAAFLRGYFEGTSDATFLHLSPAQVAVAIELLVLDKAFHELAYELNNRPDWVAIPLAGLLGATVL